MWNFLKKQKLIEETPLNVWLQLKNPKKITNYKEGLNKKTGKIQYIVKNKKFIPMHSWISNMYIIIKKDGWFGDCFDLTTFPKTKFNYVENRNLSEYPFYIKENINKYELITNDFLIKKLNCLVDKAKKDKVNEINKIKNDILKKSLEYPCE